MARVISFASTFLLGATAMPVTAQTAFFYGTPVPQASLSRFPSVVVEADSLGSPTAMQENGCEVFAYVSVGEAEGWRPSACGLPQALFIGQNEEWGSRIADLTQAPWQDYLLHQRMAPLWAAGYRGFFLDTLDSHRRATTNPDEAARQTRALIALIQAMRARFPDAKLLLNRGFDILAAVAPIVDGVVAESLFERWDQAAREYMPVPDADRLWLLARLREARDTYRLPVTVIDYVPSDKPALARETAQRIRALGFAAWVANPGLDTLPEWTF